MMPRRLTWILLGLFLLAWGLAEAGVDFPRPLPGVLDWLFQLWPLILVVWGAQMVVQRFQTRREGSFVLGGVLLALGVALLARNLGYARVSIWASILIGAGAGFLLRAVRE